jgi:hypothetical protein
MAGASADRLGLAGCGPSPKCFTFRTRSRTGQGPRVRAACTGLASEEILGTSPGLSGDARDKGLERELKDGILGAGRYLGWNERVVETFVVAVTGRRLETCQHGELMRVLVAFLDVACMLRKVAGYQLRRAAVSGSGTELI